MLDQGRSHVARDGLISIRVLGEPRPFPKKDVAKVGNRLIPVDNDYRTRKNSHTGKPEKYDKGYKRRWMATVTAAVERFMFDHNIEPFPKNHPIAIGTLFYVTKTKSNKLILPSQTPDEDNFVYAVRNALKFTPKKKGVEGKYPKGVLYYDDDQIVWHLPLDGEVWAWDGRPPGVLITVCSAFSLPTDIRTIIEEEANIDLGVLI